MRPEPVVVPPPQMPETPDFDQMALDIGVRAGRGDILPHIAAALRLVWNTRGASDRGRIGEIIGEQRVPDYSLRMAQELIKTLDR